MLELSQIIFVENVFNEGTLAPKVVLIFQLCAQYI